MDVNERSQPDDGLHDELDWLMEQPPLFREAVMDTGVDPNLLRR